jgi:hypothetical protein
VRLCGVRKAKTIAKRIEQLTTLGWLVRVPPLPRS